MKIDSKNTCIYGIWILMRESLLLLAFRDDIDSLVHEIVVNTKKLIKATSKELDKWRRP